MRLSAEQIDQIRLSAAKSFGPETPIWLFGSRVHDHKRGGDINLLVQLPPLPADEILSRKIRFLGYLEKSLGAQKIDVVIETPGDLRPIVRIAHETGIPL